MLFSSYVNTKEKKIYGFCMISILVAMFVSDYISQPYSVLCFILTLGFGFACLFIFCLAFISVWGGKLAPSDQHPPDMRRVTGSVSAWYVDGHGFDPHVRQHSFVDIGHEIISTAILSLPLIQEGQLSANWRKNVH